MNTNLPDHTNILPNHSRNHVKWLDINDVRPSKPNGFRGSFFFCSFSLFVRTYRAAKTRTVYIVASASNLPENGENAFSLHVDVVSHWFPICHRI